MDCSVDGCDKPAAKGESGLCHGHGRRKRRNQPLSTPLREYGQPGAKRLHSAALRLANAESDEDHERAMASLLKSVQRMRRRHKDNVRNEKDTPSRG
jgi:hypothetical protein